MKDVLIASAIEQNRHLKGRWLIHIRGVETEGRWSGVKVRSEDFISLRECHHSGKVLQSREQGRFTAGVRAEDGRGAQHPFDAWGIGLDDIGVFAGLVG